MVVPDFDVMYHPFGPHPYDPGCYCLSCAYEANERNREEMRSKAPQVIQINKVRDRGPLPPFVGLLHRHFQKALPALASNKQAVLNAPIDLLDMIVPDDMLDSIESIEVHYEVRS